jgi:hypothetical protein
MKWLMLPATVALAGGVTGLADAKPPTPAHARAYERAYRKVVHRLGRRAPGRDIVKYGAGARRRPSDEQTLSSLGVLQRMLSPAPSPSAAATGSSGSTASTAGAGSGAGGLPACASESGSNYSTGPDNTNSSSGATGRYQILPSTAAAYGCNLGTPAGQDACAETIYQRQGAGAWVGCGG